MKRHNVDRAHGHDLPATPSNDGPIDGAVASSNETARVVRLDLRRAARDSSETGEPLPVALAAEALRFPRDRGIAGLLASDGPWAGRMIQFALMALGVAVAIWVAGQLAKPDLGARDQAAPASQQISGE